MGDSSSLFVASANRLSTWPTLTQWGKCLILYGLFGVSVYGLNSAFEPKMLHMHASNLQTNLAFWLTAPLYFLVPSLSEEVIFRNLLQPTSWRFALKPVAFSALSLVLFVLWHPAQVWIGSPTGQAIFLEPSFLITVALLGLSCTYLTHATRSLWPAVCLHGLTVVVWKALAS